MTPVVWTGARLWTADRTGGGRGEGPGHDDSPARPGPRPLGCRADPALGRLLDPPVFAARSLWLLWLTGDRRSLPLVVPVDDLPAVPDRPTLHGLADLHETLTEDLDVTHLAMALCRPGHAVVTAEDDAWAEGLHTVLDDAVASSWSLHLAAGGRVVPVVESPTWRPPTG